MNTKRRESDKLRKQARKNQFCYLYIKNNGRCEKCKSEVVIRELIDDIVQDCGKYIWFIQQGRLLLRSTATIEHKVPLSIGGDNNEDNLALYCDHCNSWANMEHERHKRKKTYTDPTVTSYIKCRIDGHKTPKYLKKTLYID